MENDVDEVFVDRPKRKFTKVDKSSKSDGFTGQGTKNYKARIKELHEEDLDEDMNDY